MRYGQEFYELTAMMGRNFIGFQHMRMAAGARVRRFREEDASKELIKVQLDYIRTLTKDEKLLLKEIVKLYEDSELWAWCQSVKGLGPMACATFVSYINPYMLVGHPKVVDKKGKRVDIEDIPQLPTAGRAKAYMGLIPDAKLKSGKQGKFNPQARGRMYVVTTNIIRAQDPVYARLYYEKKAYYEQKMGTYLEDPTNCPEYEECLKKLANRAAKDKRAVKKPPCKAHIDNRAKRWLSGLLVSHAAEIMCRQEGLDTKNFKAHRGYIPIPPH